MPDQKNGEPRNSAARYVDECFRFPVEALLDSGLIDAVVGEQQEFTVGCGEALVHGNVCLCQREDNLTAVAFRMREISDLTEADPPEFTTQVVLLEHAAKRRRNKGWVFRCTRVVDGAQCGRAVTALYLPPSTKELGCRHCYGLSYPSTRSSNKRVRAYVNNPERLLLDLDKAVCDMKMGREDPRRVALLCEAYGGLRNANTDDMTFLRQP